jgi:hypothetical protein
MIEFLFVLAIICIIGIFVLVHDINKYKDYDMWEDENGFHMEKRNEPRD